MSLAWASFAGAAAVSLVLLWLLRRESVDPAVLVRILNGYFERMSHAITEHRGHVSVLIGDGLLAMFGALEPHAWQGDEAVHAALAMRATRLHDADILVTRELKETLDSRFRLRELPPAEVRGIAEPVAIFAVEGLPGAEPRTAGR